MMNSKKGSELALNVIIIAVIALLVLIIMAFIFGNKSSQFSKGVSTCETMGGDCNNDVECAKQVPPKPGLIGDCPVAEGAGKKYCCAKI